MADLLDILKSGGVDGILMKNDYSPSDDFDVEIKKHTQQIDSIIGLQSELDDKVSKTKQSYTGKNLIINGDFSVWQRGTSFNDIINGEFTADRWRRDPISGTVSRSTDSPSGGGYSCKFVGAGALAIIRQGVELPGAGMAGQFTIGKKLTITFWVKSSVGGETIKFYAPFSDLTNTGNETLNNSTTTDVGITTTSWQKITKSFTILYNPNPTNLVLQIATYVQDPIGDIWISDVQLEFGTEPTELEYIDPATQLSKCKRYYNQFSIPALVLKYGIGSAINMELFNLLHSVNMRIAPTATIITSPTLTNCSNLVVNANEYGVALKCTIGATGEYGIDNDGVYGLNAEF